MKEQIENKMDNKLFGIKAYSKGETINPDLLYNLNGAFELAVRVNQIENVVKVIDSHMDFIFENKNNGEYAQGQLKALADLKKEVEDGIKKQ